MTGHIQVAAMFIFANLREFPISCAQPMDFDIPLKVRESLRKQFELHRKGRPINMNDIPKIKEKKRYIPQKAIWEPNNRKVFVKWDYDNDFVLDFQSNTPRLKLRRGPIPTVAKPWPKPHFMFQNGTQLYRLDKISFTISSNISCLILKEAIARYKELLFKFNYDAFYNNVKNIQNSGFNTSNRTPRQQMLSSAKFVRRLVINIQRCSGYPALFSDESYQLATEDEEIILNATDVWGALWGLETATQLIFPYKDDFYIRETSIKDLPRFPHRGILIDSSRHFIHKQTLLEIIDGMVMNKMNALHWHLSDDQSFPFDSHVFPELSKKGAYHPSLTYTIKDIREIIEYARKRGVRIIPEFDTPGHTYSWGFSHPELLTQCYRGSEPIPGYYGPMIPSRNFTYQFLRKFFKEVLNVFTDRLVHLGGDEVPLSCWKSNKEVVRFMESLYSRSLYSDDNYMPHDRMLKVVDYFTVKLMNHLEEESRMQRRETQFIIWEEAFKNKLNISKNTVIQIWQGNSQQVARATQAGFPVIYSSCWYLDWVDHGVHWPKYYQCDPISEDFRGNATLVLGGEACLWSEYITNENVVNLLWPRASAVAERLWSRKSTRDIIEAAARLGEHRCRMLRRGISVGSINGPDFCVPSTNDNSKSEQENFSHSRRPVVVQKISPHMVRDRCSDDLAMVSLVFSIIGLLLVFLLFGGKILRTRLI